MSANETDPLAAYRALFPALARSVYLVSHSLGAMPHAASEALVEFARLWTEDGIDAWKRWLPMVREAGDRIGRLLDADPGSVTMVPNVSTAQAILASCFDYQGPRNKIVYGALEFPTVSYVWKAEERRGARVTVVPAESDGIGISTERMCEAIDDQTLLVPISHIFFRSSYVQDVAAITRRAHEVGALVCADVYQSLGTVPLSVKDWDVDFACGGSVKWLCGGPGAGYLYVRPDRLPQLQPRVTGWFGHRAPFGFEMPAQDYAESTWRMMGGTPPIAPLYHARPGVELITRIGVGKIREKSLRQTGRLIDAVDAAGWTLRGPRAAALRGGAVSFELPGPTTRSGAVTEELLRRRFLCDHRPGSGIRVSPHFYTTDDEIDAFVAETRAIAERISA